MTLDGQELARRARRIQLVLTDCDGVLTDAGVYVSARGEELKRFNLRDGMGVERLRNAGVQCAIITREKSEFALRRAEKLRLPGSFVGVQDKLAHLGEIERSLGFGPSAMAYIGDDVNDLEIMRVIGQQGLTGAPADAFEDVLEASHFISKRNGGQGAFREFAEWILRHRAEASKV